MHVIFSSLLNLLVNLLISLMEDPTEPAKGGEVYLSSLLQSTQFMMAGRARQWEWLRDDPSVTAGM